MKELKKVNVVSSSDACKIRFHIHCQVTSMLGTMLTKDELDEFMREADVVKYF